MSWMENSEVIVCNEKTVDSIKRWAELLTVYLHKVSYLTESYILDYFVDSHWNKLPHSWQNILEKFQPQDLKKIIDINERPSYRTPWPLSLLSFRACSFSLAIRRHSVKSVASVESFLRETFSHSNFLETVQSETSEWQSAELEFWNESGQHKNIPDFCRRHVKRKKQHEIFRLAQVTDIVLKHFGLKHVIDIGSGQGHLSRLLSFCHKLNVATVEAEECHISGAARFDKQAYLSLMKRKDKSILHDNEILTKSEIQEKEHCLPHHVEGSMTFMTSKDCLENILKKAWTNDSKEKCLLKFGLLGLHTCGDLAVTILKTFIESSHPQVLINVGCCYMKLNSNKNENDYPLSSHLQSLTNSSLSYEARELACHAIEMYANKLKENSASLKIHCYRAALEKCIIHYYPDKKHIGLRGVKHAEVMPFHEYAEKALSKASLPISREFLLSDDIQSCLKEWEKVLIFYSLRLMTAPCVESLVLIDRMLYLYENGYPSCIVPVFDPLISPRNHVLISARPII